MKLWADCIRVFPSTMTVLLEELGASKVAEIGDFLGLDLSESTGCWTLESSVCMSWRRAGAENSPAGLRRCFE